MSLVAGNVAINPTTGAETYTPPAGANLAKELYQARIAGERLADPNNPPTSTVQADAIVGDSTLTVDQTSGWFIGQQISVGPSSSHIVTAKSPTTLTLSPTLVAPLAAGTVLGYQGTALEWSAQATPTLVKQKQAFAKAANTDAAVFVAHITANAVVTTTVNVGGLQRTPNPNNPDTATQAPAAPVPIIGVIS